VHDDKVYSVVDNWSPTLAVFKNSSTVGHVPPVADLGFLNGGFRFRRITVIARTVSSWQASMSMQRLQSRRPSARRVEIFEFRTFEIAPAGFSGPIQRALVRRSSKLPHLFHRPCGADSYSFLLRMTCQTYYNFTVTMPTNFYRTAFLIERICRQN